METRLKSKKSALHKGSNNKVDTSSVDTIESCGEGSQAFTTLKECKNSIAMGNASDEIKKHASFITKSINEDGVSYALKRFIYPLI